MFLNIFINEVIRVEYGRAWGKKNWNFTNNTKIPLTIFHHLGGFKNLKLREGPKNVVEMTN